MTKVRFIIKNQIKSTSDGKKKSEKIGEIFQKFFRQFLQFFFPWKWETKNIGLVLYTCKIG